MNRIDSVFKKNQNHGGRTMIFFVTAGYPDIATTETIIDALVEGGADLIELGIPFSDPIADGPTIQKSSFKALTNGVTVADILEMTARVRRRHRDLALLFFSAYNPIHHYGLKAFCEQSDRVGADGMLIPDLPPEEAGELREAMAGTNLSLVFLVSPLTAMERARKICEASTGFIYYVSSMGVTGARSELPPELVERVAALKSMTDKPVAVGFGVSRPDQARAIASVCDGVIVGSALINVITENLGATDLKEKVTGYARSLSEAANSAGRG